ncbi:YqhR family membrane protein [Heyndrickxia acidiproducens]|uniref:YqhR family membrane protein n=1 Tax=Heyndrickxia acidiproducens TaxID=1121084 RepID=UPI000376C840|nr:YqhR family membrane protein [Heyndrickxia acidiproducens]
MTNEREKLKNQEHTLTFFQMVIVTGFTGGIIWSITAYLCFFFHFTSIEPNIILEPFTVGVWRKMWIGKILAILFYGLISIGAAIVYYLTLKKFKSMWAGAAYGLFLCGFVLFILNPIFPSMKPLFKLDLNTIITCACIYVVYGVFIGYSISYEHSRVEKFKKRAAAKAGTQI